MSTSNGRDPYFELLNMVRGEAAGQIPLYFCLGQILKATEEELVVLADGHELDQEDILVADWLKPAWEEKADSLLQEELTMAGRLNGSASPCPNGYHTYFDVSDIGNGMIRDKRARYKPAELRLKEKDIVLLIPDRDRQIYYLITKVVSWTDGAVPADQSA